jgi:hypothetical protein
MEKSKVQILTNLLEKYSGKKIILKEASGIKAAKEIIDSAASQLGTTTQQISKVPIISRGYPAGNMYKLTVGDVQVVIKDNKVAGAPRLNDVEVFVLSEPGATTGRRFSSDSDFSGLSQAIIEKSKVVAPTLQSKEPIKWTSDKLNELLKSLGGEKTTENEAFELADNILREYPGLEEYVKKNYRVRDVQGWLANQF